MSSLVSHHTDWSGGGGRGGGGYSGFIQPLHVSEPSTKIISEVQQATPTRQEVPEGNHIWNAGTLMLAADSPHQCVGEVKNVAVDQITLVV